MSLVCLDNWQEVTTHVCAVTKALSKRPFRSGLLWTDEVNDHQTLPVSSLFLPPDCWQRRQSCRSAWRVHGPVEFVWTATDQGWSRSGGISSSSWIESALLWPLLWLQRTRLLSCCCRCARLIELSSVIVCYITLISLRLWMNSCLISGIRGLGSRGGQKRVAGWALSQKRR